MSPDRRKSARSPAWVEAACHIRGGVHPARLSEVSSVGCRMQLALAGASPGDRVVLQLTELLALPATVVWVSEIGTSGEAGLEFASPMMGAMLGQFLLRHGKRGRLH